MIVLIAFLIAAFIVWMIVEGLHISEEGTPAKDSDILEMLELKGNDYEVGQTWDSKFKLTASTAPSIYETRYSLLFPYHISGVGMVPFWYKSADKIRELIKHRLAKSNFQVTKRDKLGLN